MVGKEGDELGIKAIQKRIEIDEKIMEMLKKLQGVPKINLRNDIPVKFAKELVDDYEITPSYVYKWDEKNKKVIVKEEPWTIKNNEGVESYSLMPAPVVISLIKQISKILGL